MGDRCYLELNLRKQDMPIWDSVFSKNKEPPGFMHWVDDVIEESDDTLHVVSQEANYGFQQELDSAAAKGAVFYGSHGVGGTYGPGGFVGVGGKYTEVQADDNGDPVVSVKPNGVVSKRRLNQVQRYLKKLKLAKAQMKPRKP